MKKSILFMLFVALFAFDLSAQQKPKRTTANEQKSMKISTDRQSSANSRSSSSRYSIFDQSFQVYKGKYLNIHHDKRNMYHDYKYEVEVYVNDGKVDATIYGENRFIREVNGSGSKLETYYEKNDLRSHERKIVIGLYGYYNSRVRVKIWKVKGQHNDCHYNDPTHDLGWLKDIKRRYPDRKICEYEIHGKKYFQVFKCGVSHYTEYWYDCYGEEVCKFENGRTCSDVRDAKFIKCWYTPNHCNDNGGQCDYRFWYDDCQDRKEIYAGKDYYVKVNAEKHHNIKWMDLYIDGRKIRREESYPYEWGRPGTSGDHQLRNMRKGTYKLKCVVYDKCGDYREEYCTIIVKDGHNNYCEKEVWYEKGKHNTHYRKHSNVYVKVTARKHQDIEWCELYVDGRKVRREMNAPYEWGKPHSNNDHLLNQMRPGSYRLKCKYKTKCGKYYEKYSTIHIDH